MPRKYGKTRFPAMLVREPTDLLFKRCVDFPWLESNADD